MIVSEGATEYRLITQNDHADLAGQFAGHWGNGEFGRPAPYHSMVLATEAHDNGWWDWDIRPSVDEEGRPVTFTKTPRDRRNRFYGRGIDNVAERDLYAGLIVSMHGVGLNKQRYGTHPGMPKRTDEYSLRFIEEREPRHKEMLARIQKMPEYDGYGSEEYVWHNWKLLQVYDMLSLYFCSNFDIRNMDPNSPYHDTIKPLPIRFGQEDSILKLHAGDSKTVRVEPYPFDTAPLCVSVRGRLIPKRVYRSQEDFRETYACSPRILFEFTLQPE